MEISECEAVGFAGIERFHAGADPLGLGHPAESAGMVSLERFHLSWFDSDGSTWSPKGAALPPGWIHWNGSSIEFRSNWFLPSRCPAESRKGEAG